jgi:molecular chaperone IbpA
MKQLVTTNPSFTLDSLHRALQTAVGYDRLFDNLYRRHSEQIQPTFPPYNIVKLGDSAYAIELAVAGYDPEGINVELVKGELVIRGDMGDGDQENTFLHHGIAGRSFVRTFALADTMEVKGASMKNGILRIALEHVIPEEDKPKTIPVVFQQ